MFGAGESTKSDLGGDAVDPVEGVESGGRREQDGDREEAQNEKVHGPHTPPHADSYQQYSDDHPGRSVPWGQVLGRSQTFARRRRRAFRMTDTLDRLIAAAAIMGLSSSPMNG